MASIWKVSNSPYFICQFRDESGKRVTRSTKQTKASVARKVAEEWEEAGRLASQNELTQAACERILNRMREATTGRSLKRKSITQALDGYLESRRTHGIKESSIKAYEPIFKSFKSFLGPERCEASVGSLEEDEVKDWRTAQIKAGLVAKTANKYVKVLAAALDEAKVLQNPARTLTALDVSEAKKQAFTDGEIRKLLASTERDDWRGMMLLGAWTGIRLSDAASLTWGNVDLDNRVMFYIPAKRSRKLLNDLEVALHEDVIAHLKKMPRGIGKAPIFPELHGRKSGSTGENAGGLSNEFARLMRNADVKNKLLREGKGRGRNTWEKGFHSFRHSMISRMAEADVPKDVRKAIAGHSASADDAHERYVHLTLDAQRRGIGALPSLVS